MFQIDVTDVYSAQTETEIARLFALAANSDFPSETPTIEVRLLLQTEKDGSQPTGDVWTRQERDTLLLCLDRSVSRVYPPLDPLQYTQPPPELEVRNGERVARIYVTPTVRLFSFHSTPHCVEGHMGTANGTPPSLLTPFAEGEGVKASGEFEDFAVSRSRWRVAAWLTARLFNESSWVSTCPCGGLNNGDGTVAVPAERCSDVIDAAECDGQKRLLHVDVTGMEFVGLITAVTSRYAYVAVPHEEEGQLATKWVLVSRVSVPPALERIVGRETVKRPREGSERSRREEFVYEREVISHDNTPFRVLRVEERMLVTLRAHKVYCTKQRPVLGLPRAVSVLFEDVAVVKKVADTLTDGGDSTKVIHKSCCNSFADVLEIVRGSCKRFLRGYTKYKLNTNGPAVERLFSALTDTVSVQSVCHGAGSRRRQRPPVTVSSPRDISSLYEGTCVEFKAKANKWETNSIEDFVETDVFGDASASAGGNYRSTSRKTGCMNMERIRHTIAAMASTLGGVLLVGVSDDGKVLGHSPDALKELRLTGFCPAMPKGTVQCTTMRAVSEDAPVTLPKEWWKNKTQNIGQRVNQQTDLVVTVITVSRGPAPVYTVARHSVPYIRGFASTLPLHVISVTRRITPLLP
ncbi:Divergent AAA domain containing protein [Trypanosoma brucei equiperdum]|uniref:Divergent AAA domain containing protein n=1 Tax=Trypanosoma brucei equiperdum TaxID=630700 RepID=A0A3L6KVZ1_9TRYP|nr:Divergent AAA domain containing protein [Trypanosoma brucei equiperdum]